MYGSQPRLEVSVPRVNTANDSWDDSAPPSESGTGEDIATVAIRRDQVGAALAAYGRGPASSPAGRVDLSHDDVRTTNQGTVMMITKPGVGGSMHRARSTPGPAAGQGSGPGSSQGGMMAPALMPPMAPPGDPSRMSLPGVGSGDLSSRVTPPEPPKSSTKLVVVAVVLAIASFAIIAALLQIVGR